MFICKAAKPETIPTPTLPILEQDPMWVAFDIISVSMIMVDGYNSTVSLHTVPKAV